MALAMCTLRSSSFLLSRTTNRFTSSALRLSASFSATSPNFSPTSPNDDDEVGVAPHCA